MVEVIFVETCGVVISDVAMGFKVVTDTFFETEETGVVDGFAVGFEVVTVTEETGDIDGFTVLFRRFTCMAERHHVEYSLWV